MRRGRVRRLLARRGSPSSEKRRRSVTRKPREDSLSSLMIGYPVASTRWTAYGVSARRLVGCQGTRNRSSAAARDTNQTSSADTGDAASTGSCNLADPVDGSDARPGQVLVKDSHGREGLNTRNTDGWDAPTLPALRTTCTRGPSGRQRRARSR